MQVSNCPFDRTNHTDTCQSVTTVKFANKSKDLFAMASQDHTVSIASLMSDPPRVLLTLFGHSEAVLGTHLMCRVNTKY